MPKSIISHPMRPGYNSQKCFRSNEPILGFNSLPIKKLYIVESVLPPDDRILEGPNDVTYRYTDNSTVRTEAAVRSGRNWSYIQLSGKICK